MEKYQTRLAEDIKAGKPWVYSNNGCSGTFNYAVKSNNRKANCATIANWALRTLKVLVSGQYFYGRADGSLACSAETLAALKAKCKVIHIDGKHTVQECIGSGLLIPWDIVTYQNMQHTNVYGGGMVWYDAGRGNTRDCASGSPFTKWKCTKVVNDPVAYIIRYRKNPPVEHYYRVQIGAYNSKSTAVAKCAECEQKVKLDTFKERMYDGAWHVFCGSFADEAKANERLAIVKKYYKKAFIKDAYI